MAAVAALASRRLLAAAPVPLPCGFASGIVSAKIDPSPDRLKWEYRGQRMIAPLGQLLPKVAVDAYVAPNVVLAGQISVLDGSSGCLEAPSDTPEKKQKKPPNSAKTQKKSLKIGDEDDAHDEAKTDDNEENNRSVDDCVALSEEESDNEKSTQGEDEDQPRVQGSDKSAASQKKDTDNSESKGNGKVEAEKEVVPSKCSKNKSSKFHILLLPSLENPTQKNTSLRSAIRRMKVLPQS